MTTKEKHIPTIFLSYSWKDFEKAEKIEKDLKGAGIKVIRDLNMNYKDSITKFMKRICNEDYAILLISNSYLNSPNCMYEVLELLKDENFETKILPIILPKTKIFKPKEQIEIIKYWENEIELLNNNLRELNSLANINEILENINHFTEIRKSISFFISKIKDLNAKSFEELNNLNYKPIIEHIGILEDDIIALTLELIKIPNLSQREIEIDNLLEKYPKNGNLSFLKANLYLEEKKYKKAEKVYLKLIESYKENIGVSTIYNNIGICYDKQGLFQEAINSYNKAIEINPEEDLAYSNLALLYNEKLKDNVNAEKNYLLSIEKNNLSGLSHSNYALFLSKKKNYLKAKIHFEKALNLKFEDPIKLSNTHYSYAILLHLNLLKFEEAKKQYEHCIKLNSKKFQAHCNLAVLLKNVFKDYKGTAFHYNEAIKINPKDSITLNNLGNLYQHQLNQKELAKYHYLKAIEFDENYEDSYNGIGFLLKNEFPDKSRKYFEKGIAINPNNSKLQFNYAKLLLEKFNLKGKAKEHYIKSITLDFRLHNNENNLLFNMKSIILGGYR
jgi:tetratricopeptide (TPR) repeat protein